MTNLENEINLEPIEIDTSYQHISDIQRSISPENIIEMKENRKTNKWWTLPKLNFVLIAEHKYAHVTSWWIKIL